MNGYRISKSSFEIVKRICRKIQNEEFIKLVSEYDFIKDETLDNEDKIEILKIMRSIYRLVFNE